MNSVCKEETRGFPEACTQAEGWRAPTLLCVSGDRDTPDCSSPARLTIGSLQNLCQKSHLSRALFPNCVPHKLAVLTGFPLKLPARSQGTTIISSICPQLRQYRNTPEAPVTILRAAPSLLVDKSSDITFTPYYVFIFMLSLQEVHKMNTIEEVCPSACFILESTKYISTKLFAF